jgi:hypothetical protein
MVLRGNEAFAVGAPRRILEDLPPAIRARNGRLVVLALVPEIIQVVRIPIFVGVATGAHVQTS